jgi:hypothetical protein
MGIYETGLRQVKSIRNLISREDQLSGVSIALDDGRNARF